MNEAKSEEHNPNYIPISSISPLPREERHLSVRRGTLVLFTLAVSLSQNSPGASIKELVVDDRVCEARCLLLVGLKP